ncbi:hypothetical protein EIN43_27055 (plasmid) [Enterobacter hormaechei]|uniref:Uncharacterized protein n=1 Tax=Enterobacter hormaechei TaxID=158836 RepID=A0A4Y5ZQ28_9ENTR|nr:hypothetical protein EIN43_27055 [Enterobacter hormaechei]
MTMHQCNIQRLRFWCFSLCLSPLSRVWHRKRSQPVSAVRATDVMVNQPSVDKGSDNTHVGDVVCFFIHCLMELFMNADEVTRILAQSSQNDWIVDDETGAFTYKMI